MVFGTDNQAPLDIKTLFLTIVLLSATIATACSSGRRPGRA